MLEGACATGRVLAPWVHYGEKRLTVTYFVRPREGAQTCPGNPPTPVTLRLDEPLGPRELVDGARPWPSRAKAGRP